MDVGLDLGGDLGAELEPPVLLVLRVVLDQEPAAGRVLPGRWLKTVVVSDEEKAPGEASGGGQEDDHC
jgi:hypothetical protein